MATSQIVCAFLLSCLLGQASASAFLRKDMSAMVADTHLHLLEELEGALGESHRQATERRMARLEDALRPTIAAMPKNADGKLEHMAVRYVLHRLFVEKHGWYVRGLAPNGETWNSSSPIAMLQNKAPQAIFENHMESHTFGLHEIAVLAATLENLVHDETIERVKSAFNAHGIIPEYTNLTEEQMEEVIETYMIHYVMRSSDDIDDTASPQQIRKTVLQVYPKWPETVQFVRNVRREVLDRSDANPYALNFNDTMKVVEEIGERYGRWQDRECRELKHDLIKLESQGTGRVLLKDFYSAAAEGAWQFSESVNYLRGLGALDESDPARLKVIIANYINSPSNCVASSNFYSVCCIDECEALHGQLERTLASPEATPESIAKIISSMPSPTVDAPRDISVKLRGLLDEIANGHQVRLHTRLFAQFMHHAYPRECSFPHVTGTTRPRTVDEWMNEYGEESVSATAEEMTQHIKNAVPHKEQDELPWIAEEELFCSQSPGLGPSVQGHNWRSAGRSIAFVVFLLSASLMLIRNVASTKINKNTNPNKFYV